MVRVRSSTGTSVVVGLLLMANVTASPFQSTPLIQSTSNVFHVEAPLGR